MLPRRRVLATGWAHAREMFASVMAERDALRQELRYARHDYCELLATMREMQAEVRALRSQAEARVAELHRQRTIKLAERVVRDPAQRLN